jgi:hypothetical protein
MTKPPNSPEFSEISFFPSEGQIQRSLHRLVCTFLISGKTCAKKESVYFWFSDIYIYLEVFKDKKIKTEKPYELTFLDQNT